MELFYWIRVYGRFPSIGTSHAREHRVYYTRTKAMSEMRENHGGNLVSSGRKVPYHRGHKTGVSVLDALTKGKSRSGIMEWMLPDRSCANRCQLRSRDCDMRQGGLSSRKRTLSRRRGTDLGIVFKGRPSN